MPRHIVAIAIGLLAVGVSFAQDRVKDAIQKVEAAFEPAEAKPGQTVTLKLTVKLADGYHTYPITQPAPEAKYSTNSITFPKDGPVVFVGETVDPVDPKAKKVDDYDLLVYPGGGTWIRKAVVPPSAKPGDTTAKVKIKLLVCDENNCFPPKTVELDAAIKVLDAPAVPVEAKYKDEVEKAGKR